MTLSKHNDIVVFMIPAFDPKTGYLPLGLHVATWAEITDRFARNEHRLRLTSGLLEALRNLAAAGCQSILLDGSYVSEKPLPGDYDAAWDTQGVDPKLLDPVLLDFTNKRAAMKAKYCGELFPATARAAPGLLYRDFFQKDKNGVPKGVVHLQLGGLP